MSALETKTGMHVMMGSGSATDGVLAACAVKALGGDMQGRLLLRDDEERAKAAGGKYREGTVLGQEHLLRRDRDHARRAAGRRPLRGVAARSTRRAP
jgi:hypothetical protein